MATLTTAPYNGYQVLFSPYSPHKLAFVGAMNYGIAGTTLPNALLYLEHSRPTSSPITAMICTLLCHCNIVHHRLWCNDVV